MLRGRFTTVDQPRCKQLCLTEIRKEFISQGMSTKFCLFCEISVSWQKFSLYRNLIEKFFVIFIESAMYLNA